jgi:LacI family transcriptional regulator
VSDQTVSKRTIHEVARRAKVSITTVSRTINSPAMVEPATRKRVLTAIEELKYYPDTHARSLVSGRSRILGLIVSDITNPFFPELVKGFEDVATAQGYDVLVSSTNYDSARMALCVRRMLERKVEGVAVMTSEMDDHLIEQFAGRNVPMVFLDVGSPGERLSNIIVDYAMGVNEAVEHLVNLGHRRIAFVSGPHGLQSAQVRRAAFLEALDRYGIAGDERTVVEGDHKVSGGLLAMEQLLAKSERPTAVLGSNDLTAVGMLRAARRAGVTVPHGLSIVGFDDIWLAEFTDPPLTTVRLSRLELADKACSALIGKSKHEGEYCIKTHLVVRESTAPPA